MQICNDLSVSASPSQLPWEGSLSAAAGFNPSVSFADSSLYTREPWGHVAASTKVMSVTQMAQAIIS